MYLVRTPEILKPLFKDLLWNVPGSTDTVYLTFDDGPIPEVTPWVLDQLKEHGAKATFFCLGRNAELYRPIFDRIMEEGHTIGNHTYDHVNGWNTTLFAYLRNVLQCQQITRTDLFRPPYGRITREQAKALEVRFKVVMWEVLSADFDVSIDGQQCYRNVIDNMRPGSVIVFHDSLKAADRLQVALPLVMKEIISRGWKMEALRARTITA
jgi:peptidoglycan/xylan/chitin deacetylase (PgdA/CDA1 family)